MKGYIRNNGYTVKNMGKLIQGILDSLKLTDEDDFDDDEPVARRSESFRSERSERSDYLAASRESSSVVQPPKRFDTREAARPVRSIQARPSSYEEEADNEPRRVSRPERQPVPIRSASKGLEVIIRQPTSFDDSQEICDFLKEERAVIVNLENVDPLLAQKMMDFISGAIYALDAKIHQISACVFCISPEKVDISGDYFNMISENSNFKIPDLLKK